MHILLCGYQFKTLTGSNFQMNFKKKYFKIFAQEKQTLFMEINQLGFKNLGTKKSDKDSPSPQNVLK
jgi:hypothetical protein